MPFIKNVGIFAKKAPASVPLPDIAAGTFDSALIKTNGRAFGWGYNVYGQVGNNGIAQAYTPVSVVGATKTFCKISSGGYYTAAIDKNGRVWTWGYNDVGQLGNNSTISRLTPVSVLGAVKTFCHIVLGRNAGGNRTLALDKNGRAWGWGVNQSGQIGDNTQIAKCTPVSVAGGVKTFCKIGAGLANSLAIDKNGLAWGWGNNQLGQLADGTTTQRNTPVSVIGVVKTFCEITGGGYHTIAIDKNGRLWGWGLAAQGQLGNNSTFPSTFTSPVSICGAVKTFCKISAGERFSLALDKNGRAWAWGLNSSGQLGDNTLDQRLTPVSVAGTVKTFCDISAGATNFSLAIDKDGKGWGWGDNTYGQLGVGNRSLVKTPLSVLGQARTFCTVRAAECFTIVVDQNGQAWGWGTNSYGTLGDNTTTQRNTPVSVLNINNITFCKISGATFHSIGLGKDGQIWTWGWSLFGQLGDNSTQQRNMPTSICGVKKTFCEINAGFYNSFAIDYNGKAWAWGYGAYGTNGNNSTSQENTPVSVYGSTTFCKISGALSALTIDNNGLLWAWGYGLYGQIGDNQASTRLTPVRVCNNKTFCQIAVGNVHCLAIDKDGRVWGWGNNGNGQVGDNSFTTRYTPVSILGTNKTFCKISTYHNHSVAIDKNGRAWGWGYNVYGQLGDNTQTDRRTPVSVAGTVRTFCEISAGLEFTIAIDKDGKSWGWGSRTAGRTGNVDVFYTPTRICTL